ncbi:MAG: hypothetical protein IPM63_15590 [Acidobacteriota bacterium]|nr:MAG: hypothetical protein IPM63_15590 [Acidobacteriota bacterium]
MLKMIGESSPKERRNAKWLTHLTISAIYLGIACFAYFQKLGTLLYIIGLPWSTIISVFAFLIIHVADDGEAAIDFGMLAGAFLNGLIWMVIIGVKTTIYARWRESRPQQ